MDHFDYKNGIYHAEDVPLDALAQAVGTPFYCYSTATLTRHFTVFRPFFRPDAENLLRGQSQQQPRGVEDAGKARGRGGCGFRRRNQAGAESRNQAG